MTGLLAAVDSSSDKSRNSRCSCFAPDPGNAAHWGQQLCRGRHGQMKTSLTLVQDLDHATEHFLLNTLTSLAAGLECVALIFMPGQLLT